MVEQKIKEQCDALLMSMLGSEGAVERWWRSPNHAFAEETAERRFEQDPESVLRYLMSCCDGYW
jgi:hypothetical protein